MPDETNAIPPSTTRTTEAPADLYLVLDLEPRTDEAVAAMPDALPFAGVAALMRDAAINGQGWHREWHAFGDRASAMEYASRPGHPALVVIPLRMETVPLSLTP